MLRTLRDRLHPRVIPPESLSPASYDVDPAPALPVVDLVVFARDCVLSGQLALTAERVSDVLNGDVSFGLLDVMVEDFVGGPSIKLRSIAVMRDDILLVHAGGPRGNPARRQHTRQHPIVARVGPYEVRGYIHTSPGATALTSITRRKPMVAVTDAVIEFNLQATPQVRHASVVILNRDAIDWISNGDVDPVHLPVMPVVMGPLVKDFTRSL